MSCKLFIALDSLAENERGTLTVARELSSQNGSFGFKINLDYMLFKGVGSAISQIRKFNRPIFADLKMWNGSRTMESVTKHVVDLGVEYFNIYALADEQMEKAIAATEGSNTKLLAVTILSHYDSAYVQRYFGMGSLTNCASALARQAVTLGCHGVVLPGTVLASVADLQTEKFVPGVRPTWFDDDRHDQEISPSEAFANGATSIVCGSPIMKSLGRVGIPQTQALQQILSETLAE